MQTSVVVENQNDTDYYLLEEAFGGGYFILVRIRDKKIVLSKEQKEELLELINERNHFGILWFINKLRGKLSFYVKHGG